MRHPKAILWERRLKEVFDQIDGELESKYGDLYQLHPNRARRGETSNPEYDGLFNVGASFSAGYGSELGRGYVIDVDMVTLDRVPDEVERKIELEVVERLRKLLPVHFPESELEVTKDGKVFKIHGDFSLGSASDGGM